MSEISPNKKKLYEKYLTEFNHKGSLELANCFYVAYSIGYAESSEYSYNANELNQINMELRIKNEQLESELAKSEERVKELEGNIENTSFQCMAQEALAKERMYYALKLELRLACADKLFKTLLDVLDSNMVISPSKDNHALIKEYLTGVK